MAIPRCGDKCYHLSELVSITRESRNDLIIYKGDQGTCLILIMILEMAEGCIRLLQACLFVRMTLDSIWVFITSC